MKRAVLLLTAGRLGLFLLCALVIRLVSVAVDRPANGLVLLLLALFVSSPLGIVLFAPQRRALAEALQAQRDAKAAQAAARRERLDTES